jgi:hypothetical protein
VTEDTATTTVTAIPMREASIKLYPNPCQNVLFVETERRDQIATVQILNTTGGVVQTLKGDLLQKFTIRAENLKPGIYFLRTINKKGIHIQRFIKA